MANQIRQLMLTMDRPVSDRPGTPVDRSAALATISELITNIVMLVGSGAGTTAQVEREQGRSVSFARYDIRDIRGPSTRHAGDLVALSGEIPNISPEGEVPAHQPGMNRFFQSLRVRGTRNIEPADSPNPAHRFHDSEIKLLEFLAHRITEGRDIPNDSAPGAMRFRTITGWIHLNSDFVTCGSCAFVIGQFRQVFPNVQLIAQSNERLSPAEERRQAELVAGRLM
jgi:hypothetical protein